MRKEQAVREELSQCRELMADLFQSGLTVVPESLKQRLQKRAMGARQYGMDYLADKLTELTEMVEKRRHEIRREEDGALCELFCQIDRYLEEGIRQAGLDEAGAALCKKEWGSELL